MKDAGPLDCITTQINKSYSSGVFGLKGCQFGQREVFISFYQSLLVMANGLPFIYSAFESRADLLKCVPQNWNRKGGNRLFVGIIRIMSPGKNDLYAKLRPFKEGFISGIIKAVFQMQRLKIPPKVPCWECLPSNKNDCNS